MMHNMTTTYIPNDVKRTAYSILSPVNKHTPLPSDPNVARFIVIVISEDLIPVYMNRRVSRLRFKNLWTLIVLLMYRSLEIPS